MRIFITGSRGFIGSNLTYYFRNKSYKIYEFDVKMDPRLDITDLSILHQEIMKAKPEVVIHLAANSSVSQSVENPILDLNLNTRSTLNLIFALSKLDPKPYLVFTSTAQLYGEPQYLPIDEKHPLNPKSPYAISKYAAENYIKFYATKYDLKYTILRLFNVYGPGQQMGFVVPDLIHKAQAITGSVLELAGSPNDSRDFLYVEDLASAIEKIIEQQPQNQIINMGSGTGTKISKLALLILDFLDKRDIKVRAAQKTEGKVSRLVANVTKAKEMLKWQPHVKLRDGLKKTISSYLNT